MGKERRERKKEKEGRAGGRKRRKRKTTFTSFHTHKGFEEKWPSFSFHEHNRERVKSQEIYA